MSVSCPDRPYDGRMTTTFWPHIEHRKFMERSRRSIEHSLAVLRLPYWPRDYFPPNEDRGCVVRTAQLDGDIEKQWRRLAERIESRNLFR